MIPLFYILRVIIRICLAKYFTIKCLCKYFLKLPFITDLEQNIYIYSTCNVIINIYRQSSIKIYKVHIFCFVQEILNERGIIFEASHSEFLTNFK